jgi:hypothetical protein
MSVCARFVTQLYYADWLRVKVARQSFLSIHESSVVWKIIHAECRAAREGIDIDAYEAQHHDRQAPSSECHPWVIIEINFQSFV